MGAHGRCSTFTRGASCCGCYSHNDVRRRRRTRAKARTTAGRHEVATRFRHRIVLSCNQVGRWLLRYFCLSVCLSVRRSVCSVSLSPPLPISHALSSLPLFSCTHARTLSVFLFPCWSAARTFARSLALSLARAHETKRNGNE